MQPEWWNPETGEIHELNIFRQHDEQTLIPLTLQPSESGFIVFRKPLEKMVYDGLMKNGEPLLNPVLRDKRKQSSLIIRNNLPVFDLSRGWTILFPEGKGAMESQQVFAGNL